MRFHEVVLGRERFAQIGAVEGIKPTAAMKKRTAEFNRLGVSPAERRRGIIKVYRKADCHGVCGC